MTQAQVINFINDGQMWLDGFWLLGCKTLSSGNFYDQCFSTGPYRTTTHLDRLELNQEAWRLEQDMIRKPC